MSRRLSVLRGEAATTRASAEAVWRVLADPRAIPLWFKGARDVDAGAEYPSEGSDVSWRVGGWSFRARVERCEPARILQQVVDTPSATSTITNRIVPRDGTIVYQKVVEARWKSWLGGVVSRPIVARSVPREVARVVELAERQND